MKILDTQKAIEGFLAKLQRRAKGPDPEIITRTAAILADIEKHGDSAVKKYTARFDGHSRIRISPEEVARYAAGCDAATLKALRHSASRIRKFHMLQRESSWSVKEKGITLGQVIRPLQRVGVYVPGGKAAYPSTVLMNVIPAQVAGVEEIAVTVPTPKGEINPYVMAAINMLGVKEVHALGGAQAVGALAYGTKTIKAVDKIVGPGNIYVATAKRMVFGTVDIDMIAGPSEILILADESADPAFIAADMLSQAEHDELASSVLVTDSIALARRVEDELKPQLAALGRSAIARKSLNAYGAAIVVRDMDAAVEISNSIAPEHLEVITRSPRKMLKKIRNAGAIFLGPWTPEPLGDYAAGPNHTLPTGGTSRWASPLGVYDFFKRSSLLEFSKDGFRSIADTVMRVADREGLGAHVNSVRVRAAKIK